jgi:HCOMODA/2-hydroxy-3-carboxy-muconic semialdehyde decarboxylase
MITSTQTIATVKELLAAGSRILSYHGIVDAFGHISARSPNDPTRFFMSRRLAPALVEVNDIREFNMSGELCEPNGTSVFLERHIHGCIYVERPDVMAVVHSHASSTIAYGLVPNARLRAVCHTCGFLKSPVPIFEIRNVSGDDSDLLVSDRRRGEALATSLAEHSVVLMRGHGSTVVGGSVQQAVYRAIYLDTNAKIQSEASALGELTYLTDAEADATERNSRIQEERTWEVWLREVSSGWATAPKSNNN